MNGQQHDIKMWTPHTVILFVLMLVGLAAMTYRLLYGLGAASGMNDVYPWGFWLAFDVLGGVAMAAGGFIIACAIYIFNWKKYKPIGRPAILTAFLGYLMAVVALFLDIGHPLRLWHPMVMWQVHSVMWVVAIHVILYTTTLGIESSPMLLEKLGWQRTLAVLKKLMVGAVIFGVMLSTLHQASLGAVFLITGPRMSPLWYTQFLPYLFLVSAIAMGLAMVSMEAMFSSWAFNHRIPGEIFTGLAAGLRNTLAVYLVLKLFFLIKNAGIGAALDGSLAGNMYLAEMLIGVVMPLAVLTFAGTHLDRLSLLVVNVLVIGGVLLNRLNVCLFSMEEYAEFRGGSYLPTLPELLITLGIVALGVFLFKMAAKHLPLFAAEN